MLRKVYENNIWSFDKLFLAYLNKFLREAYIKFGNRNDITVSFKFKNLSMSINV